VIVDAAARHRAQRRRRQLDRLGAHVAPEPLQGGEPKKKAQVRCPREFRRAAESAVRRIERLV
jgi:hypothetical protein